MSATTPYDTGAPTIEVRIYLNDQLLARELCETEEDVARVVEHWADVDNVYVLVDDLSAHHTPGDILAPDDFLTSDDDYSIASAPAPGYGTE